MAIRWAKWTAVGISAGAIGAMAAMSQACTVLVSDAPWDGGGPATDAAPPDDANVADAPTASPACNQCLVDSCAAQWSLCTSSSECMAIYTCATAPSCVNDNACVATCYNGHPQGQAAYDALSSCDANAMYCGCAGTCGVDASSSCASPDASPEADGASDSGDAGLTCAACSAQSCGTESAACGAGSACEAYHNCLAVCTDAACVDKCANDNAQGKQDSDKLASCLSQNCAAPCGLQ